uniref:F-box domain-containing protein n=1 Tax=Tanacetum cinerariifolium TaxID=118510 RepID=A0A6L2MTE4_TANCI|nr:hypothetical protein [Tanacetum cinerariifolium]
MEKVSDDISGEILIRLPAKSIGRLRCVCKRWNTLLCEPNFIKSHLHRCSINNNKDEEVLLVFNRGFLPKAHPCASPDIELTNFVNLTVNFPSEEAQIHSTVIGSANGLICFSVGFFDDSVIHIWNPSISALLTVPPYAIPVPSDSPNVHYNFRFGFDPENDDYKIVKLIRADDEWLQVEVSIDGHDGHLHWLCFNDDLEIHTIVAFHLAAESFTEISLPDPIAAADYDNLHTWFDLGVFSGMLCVISSTRGVGDCGCEVWVMDGSSWVETGFSHSHIGGITPCGFTFKNNFLYQDCNQVLHLYDSAANKVKPFHKVTPNLSSITDIIIIPYAESLVWVTPPTPAPATTH